MVLFKRHKQKIQRNFNTDVKLIVGLGNFGDEYENTRHNCGFMAIDYIAQVLNLELTLKKFNGVFFKGKIEGINFILAKSMGYMNHSGFFINDIINYFKISFDNILVICDCNDIMLGHYKLKKKVNKTKHNGIIHISNMLQTYNIQHLRIGIRNIITFSTRHYVLKQYVLAKFTFKELEVINNMLQR